MARKQPTFKQLVEYMDKESASPQTLSHNFYSHERSTQEEIIKEFMKNSLSLPKRKNGNYLYHEVISFEGVTIGQEKLDEMLLTIGELYLSERAPKQLAYAVIHKDTDKPHIHFCISANEYGSATRKRLTKQKFSNIQKNIEIYVLQNYPELETRAIYTKDRNPEKLQTKSREQELKKRSGKLTKKEQLKNELHGLFELANTHIELVSGLKNQGYEIYTRGKNVGIQHKETGRKHRFTTLGVIEHYLSALERFDSVEKQKRAKQQSQQPEQKQKDQEQTSTVKQKKPRSERTPKKEQVKPQRQEQETPYIKRNNTEKVPPKNRKKESKKEESKTVKKWKKLTLQERKNFLRKPFKAIKKTFSKEENTYTKKAAQATNKKTTAQSQTFKKKSHSERVKPSKQKIPKTSPKKQKKPVVCKKEKVIKKAPQSKEQEALDKRLADLERITGKQKNKDRER